MIENLGKVKNAIAQGFIHTVATGKAITQQAISWDRSNQSLGKTNEAQLRGRSKEIVGNLVGMLISMICLGYGVYACFTSPGLFNYFMVGVTSVSSLIQMKEVALQSIARAREKEQFKIEESFETTYSLTDLFNDYLDTLIQTTQNIGNILTGRVSKSQENRVDEISNKAVELVTLSCCKSCGRSVIDEREFS